MKKRIAAEWEPAIGVMFAWPLFLPHKLVQEFAKDTHVYLLVSDDEAIEAAKRTFDEWEVDPTRVTYVKVSQGDDCSWPRDFGPHALFDERGEQHLLGPSYLFSTPFANVGHDAPLLAPDFEEHPIDEFESDGKDDLAAGQIAKALGVDFIKLPFAFTGGNMLTDGVNSIISTEILLFENRYKGFSDDEYFSQVAEVTGMTNYTVLSDYEDLNLNHIDCLAKPIDDRRIIVLRFPKSHPHYDIVEHIVDTELAGATNSYGEPWEIIRLDTDYFGEDGGVAAYSNSLLLNKCVYVPMYGIHTDEGALETFRAALPGYDVKGFTFVLDDEPASSDIPREDYEEIGWQSFDVLHCRTRAVWDSKMLYVRATRPLGTVCAGEPYRVHATIVAYSGEELTEGMPKLHWRANGGAWTSADLEAAATREVFTAEIPGQAAGTTVEYYVECSDASGRHEFAPRVAPAGTYSYVVR